MIYKAKKVNKYSDLTASQLKKYFIIVILLISIFLHGQETPEKVSLDKWWINGGLGKSSIAGDGGLSAYTSINYTFDQRIIKFRYFLASEFDILGDTPSIDAWEYGLLYGYFIDKERTSISVMAGISYTGGRYRGDFIEEQFFGDKYEEVSYETFGIPIEVQYNMNMSKYAGLGLTVFGNVNLEKSIIGINLNLILGKLK